VAVRLHYHPFMIDPGTQPDGEEYMSYNRRRWGSDSWTDSMKAMGQMEGAPYANWKMWPNTTHCSRALMLAEKHSLGDALIGKLYSMCYEEGENVSLRDTVSRAVTVAGVPGGAEFVQGDEGLKELHEELRTATTPSGKRVSAAPTFSIRVADSPVGELSGAQDTEHWLSILEQCKEMFEQ
jgi:predicted DsbA family dithiol-disulfide isomerase